MSSRAGLVLALMTSCGLVSGLDSLGVDGSTADVSTGQDATPDVVGVDAGSDVSDGSIVDATGTDDAPGCIIPALHPADPGSLYCGGNDAATTFYCDAGLECCLGGKVGSQFAPDQCASWDTACPNPLDGSMPIECEQTSDCTVNAKVTSVCCLQGATAPAPTSGCPASDLKAMDGTGTVCEPGTTCSASGDLQICETQAECAGIGKTCTAFHWKIFQMGFCM
jgi:hypothetical protein